jgi:hypothetical protein
LIPRDPRNAVWVDTSIRHVTMTPMPRRTKRTYNLAEPTVRHVREMVDRYGAARTQDGVVDLAVERLYVELREKAETEQWTQAATDPEFRDEGREIERAYSDAETWPA